MQTQAKMNLISAKERSTYCYFNSEFHEQIFGLTMGSALSATASNFVMEENEAEILKNRPHQIIFYYTRCAIYF